MRCIFALLAIIHLSACSFREGERLVYNAEKSDAENVADLFAYTMSRDLLSKPDQDAANKILARLLPEKKGFYENMHWRISHPQCYDHSLEYYVVWAEMFEDDPSSFFHQCPVLVLLISFRKVERVGIGEEHGIYRNYKSSDFVDTGHTIGLEYFRLRMTTVLVPVADTRYSDRAIELSRQALKDCNLAILEEAQNILKERGVLPQKARAEDRGQP